MARKTRKHRKHRKSKDVISKTIQKSTTVVKETSKQVMPKVKSGLENVGSKVIRSSKRSVPYLQRLTRKLFSKIPFLK